MKTPRFFMGGIILFWGLQVQLTWIAPVLAAVLESAFFIKSRFELRPKDFNKFIDISTVLLAGTVVIFLSIDSKKAAVNLLKWLPVVFFPVMAAQVFSSTGRIDTRSFFLAARKSQFMFKEKKTIDISYAYALLCLLSAGSANPGGELFYAGAALFSVWALYRVKPGHVPVLLWSLCILMITVSGYAGHHNIRRLSEKFTHWMMSYYMSSRTDPFKAYTAMGDLGELKLSNSIVLRIQKGNYREGETELLHTATYDRFGASNWFSSMKFKPVDHETGKDRGYWRLNPPAGNTEKMTMYIRPEGRKRAVLSLPAGILSISQLWAESLSRNSCQTVRVRNAPAFLKARVEYSGRYSYDMPPDASDLVIPKKELPAVRMIADELGLSDKSPEEVLNAIKVYFLNNYNYSLELKGKGRHQTFLQNFLLGTRSGHCEFFATAAALLLRQAGIPARYATGFIAHEFSTMEERIIVRKRDAHAWVKVYKGGLWVDFDTTPPSFLEQDLINTGRSPFSDLISFLGFELSRLRHETGAELMERYGLWLTLPLALILLIRLKRTGSIRKISGNRKTGENGDLKSRRQLFYLLEQILAEKGCPRHSYETRHAWLNRTGSCVDSLMPGTAAGLRRLLMLHNTQRFSQNGLAAPDKKILESELRYMIGELAPGEAEKKLPDGR